MLAAINLIMGVFTYFKSDDIAHLALAAIYSIVIGLIFTVFRWRFRRGMRYVPAILFTSFATYICLGALGVGKNMMRGLEDGNR